MASEAGHWYKKDGSPCYTIEGKNGQIRPTTLRDAKKLGLVPSVTTIIRCAAAPGLENWKQDQAILAALTCPRIEGESEADMLSRIKKDAAEQAKKAAERGTQIHAWVQGWFEDKEEGIEAGTEEHRFCMSVNATIFEAVGYQEWVTEKSFATPRYGGKCDLHNEKYTLDFKTTDKDISTVKTWDEHAMQLAAYCIGMYDREPWELSQCGIVYINVNTAESRLIWIPEDELEKGWMMFAALLDYWYAKNGMEAA
jgi:hypothetical protein